MRFVRVLGGGLFALLLGGHILAVAVICLAPVVGAAWLILDSAGEPGPYLAPASARAVEAPASYDGFWR